MKPLCILLLLTTIAISTTTAAYITFECRKYNDDIQILKDTITADWWIQLGDKMLMHTDNNNNLFKNTKQCRYRQQVVSYNNIFIMQRNKQLKNSTFVSGSFDDIDIDVLVSGWGFYVIGAHTEEAGNTVVKFKKDGWRVDVYNNKNLILIGTALTQQQLLQSKQQQMTQQVGGDVNAVPIKTLVDAVDGGRWFADVATLSSFNRYTLGTGIASAQQWLVAQLTAITKDHANAVTIQSFPVRSSIAYNIIVTIKGSTTPDDWIIIGGHYDSTSQSPTTLAPGAEDNASGAAATVEMIRVFSAHPPPSTAIFVLFSGEEQGLYGSNYHATQIVNEGMKYKVKLMHNMDMIAYKAASNPNYQVLLETNPPYEGLFTAYTNSAKTYVPELQLLYSTYAFGSDHEPYLNRGMPALLTIDGDWESYPSYHRTTDTTDKCNQKLGELIVKMGVGAVAQYLGYSP